jgi:hypothetical protein
VPFVHAYPPDQSQDRQSIDRKISKACAGVVAPSRWTKGHYPLPGPRPRVRTSGVRGPSDGDNPCAWLPSRLVAQYRQFATDYRRLAARLTEPADQQALELFAVGWDRTAENREAMLRSKEWVESVDVSSVDHYFFRVAMGLNYETQGISTSATSP